MILVNLGMFSLEQSFESIKIVYFCGSKKLRIANCLDNFLSDKNLPLRDFLEGSSLSDGKLLRQFAMENW